jgi:hypothetical protein
MRRPLLGDFPAARALKAVAPADRRRLLAELLVATTAAERRWHRILRWPLSS